MFKLWHGDCLELMKDIPDGSIDAVICDPPYGTTQNKWDSIIDLDAMWAQLRRIVKPSGAIALFSSQPFTSRLVMSNVKEFKYEWIWEKSIGANPLLCKKRPMKYHENICLFYRRQCTYNPQMTKGKFRNKKPQMYGCKADDNWGGAMREFKGDDNFNNLYYPRSYQYFSNANQKDKRHPTQKPVALLEYLVKTYTNESDTVLDFTMGSGSTGVACAKTNRNFIGIELDRDYYDIAVNRINEAKEAANGNISQK